jgi:DNA polymerase alpha-associated DNA helicase A
MAPKPPPPPQPLPPQAHLTTLLSLLTLELKAETAQSSLLLTSTPPTLLARAGLALLNLSLASYRTGLGGRTVLELVPDPATGTPAGSGKAGSPELLLGEHGIRTGDIVRVGERPRDSARKKEVREVKGRGVEGVVVRVSAGAVMVAVGGKGEEDGEGIEGLSEGRLWLYVFIFLLYVSAAEALIQGDYLWSGFY